MKVLNYIVILTLPALLFFGCRKKEVISKDIPVLPMWFDVYYGTYSFTDTSDNTAYTMTVERIDRKFLKVGDKMNILDSVLIRNYGNMFDIYTSYNRRDIYNSIHYSNWFDTEFRDKNGIRWNFHTSQDNNNDNKLIENTISIYFKIDNIKYFNSDSTTYFGGYIRHNGVKVN